MLSWYILMIMHAFWLAFQCCSLLFLLKLQGLISGSAETREQAAQGLGELIDVTSEKTLREFVVPITGYFFLLLCFYTSIVVLKNLVQVFLTESSVLTD